MMGFLKSRRAKSPAPVEAPVLTTEDEEFLHRIATEGITPDASEQPPPLPARPGSLLEAGNPEGNDRQIALLSDLDLDNISLPEASRKTGLVAQETEDGSSEQKADNKKSKKPKWSWKRKDSRDATLKTTASDLMGAAKHAKSTEAKPKEGHTVSESEAQKEEMEMAEVLEQLNLAAVDNRVFSISKESRELLTKFTLVLKDLVNGVPTAYGDLESLLTNSEDQLQRSYKHLPSWIQKLVEQLPSKMTNTITPELLAAAAERAGAEKDGVKLAIPTLKDLVTKPGVVVTMLKAIMNFLRVKFPAFLGMNVLYSLALFVLLFVFWYCHKRGREVRLEKERSALGEETLKSGSVSASSRSSSRASFDKGQNTSSLVEERKEKGKSVMDSKSISKGRHNKVVTICNALATKQAESLKAAPSKASLDGQESCNVS